MSDLVIDTPRVFVPLLSPSRYKGAWGGRGSGKSHFFAELLIEDCLAEPGNSSGVGMRAVCIREVQKSLKESSKRLIEDKLQSFGLGQADGFKVFNEVIQTPGDGVIVFQGMQDHTAESIKSLEGFKRAWCEEAQTLSAHSLKLLRPTIRADGSELWFSWNPRRKTDPVDYMLRGEELPTGSAVVKANWRDNPMFPAVLEAERLDCLRANPDEYDHIWEGGYATVATGAYYAKSLAEARAQGRIGRVSADPLMTIRLFVDIGGTGARADAFAMWAAQFIGKEIRVIDYYEAVGQPLATHLEWMRERGYTQNRAQVWLPHDGATQDKVFDVSYQSALRSAGYTVTVVPNQGKGAAKARIEAARRLFPSIWFNEESTAPGIEALGYYHEKRDEARNIGLGPEHDWSSHGCFHGNTKVLTRYGTRRIMDLPKTGEVLTPCGWKQYTHPRITKTNARLVEVLFAGGYSVKCTPDHLFLTGSGWKSAESLMRGTLIQSSLTNLPSISGVIFIGRGRQIDTFRKAAVGFIETYGKRLLGLFRPAAIFTTETATQQTTESTIWSVLTPRSICGSSGRPGQYINKARLAMQLEKKPPNGTGLTQVRNGISGTLSVLKAGQNGSVSRSLVLNVASCLTASFAKAAIRKFIARQLARLPHIGSVAKQTNTLLRIERVRQLNERADVWDITVPDGHWFSLENGAVVHNSDAFGLLCVAYEEPHIKKPAPRNISGAGGWMG